MLPMLALRAAHPGILYLNGHFAGEVSDEAPLLRPATAQGALYLDYRPLSSACQPMARRIVFSGGRPMPASAASAENLRVVVWMRRVVEIELLPSAPKGEKRLLRDGRRFLLDADAQLFCDGRFLGVLPEEAEMPEARAMDGGVALTGKCADGEYLLTVDADYQNRSGFLRARQLQIEPDGRICVVTAANDLVGHAMIEVWRLTPEGLMRISGEPAWANGAPRWPKTGEETARAAVEAAVAGLDGEAERYLAPSMRARNLFAEIRRRCDLCVPMKYASPDARPCIGLLRLESENLAEVQPLYFHAQAAGGPQGSYQIDDFAFE